MGGKGSGRPRTPNSRWSRFRKPRQHFQTQENMPWALRCGIYKHYRQGTRNMSEVNCGRCVQLLKRDARLKSSKNGAPK